MQAEAADLAGRDVNVVGAGQVVVVRAAEEAEAVGQDFQRPLAEHQAVLLDPLLEDLEDQVLLLQAGVLADAFGLGGADELRHGHLLKLGEMDLAALDVFVAVMNRVVAVDVFFLVDDGLRCRGIAIVARERESAGGVSRSRESRGPSVRGPFSSRPRSRASGGPSVSPGRGRSPLWPPFGRSR